MVNFPRSLNSIQSMEIILEKLSRKYDHTTYEIINKSKHENMNCLQKSSKIQLEEIINALIIIISIKWQQTQVQKCMNKGREREHKTT